MATVAFVSVARKYEEGMTIPELEEISYGFWATSLDSVSDVEALIPIYRGHPLVGFYVRRAYVDPNTTYTRGNGAIRHRVAFSLGEAFALPPVDTSELTMRSGIQVKELDVVVPKRRKA